VRELRDRPSRWAKFCFECATPVSAPGSTRSQETRRFSSSPRGLAIYLHEKDGTALFRRITEQFPRGQIAFDGYSGTMVHPQLRS
jgi:hypothetical protein